MDIMDAYLERFKDKKVEDIILGKTDIIRLEGGSKKHWVLIFESPHKEELVSRMPMVGLAGKSAAKALGCTDGTPLGVLAEREKRISIINTCQLPLQPQKSNLQGEESYFSDIESMRQQEDSELYRYIAGETKNNSYFVRVRDYIKKLDENKVDYDICICGEFAKAVFDIVKGDLNLKKVPRYICHPSFGWWARSDTDTKQFIEDFKKSSNS